MYYPFDYKFEIIKPDLKLDYQDQLIDCLQGVRKLIRDWNGKIFPIRINLFFKTSDVLDCENLSKEVDRSGLLKEIRIDPIIIAQAPTDGAVFQAIVTGVSGLKDEHVIYSSSDGRSYVTVKADNRKWLYIGASGCSSSDITIRQSSNTSFGQVSSILEKEGMKFHHIIRQWNYIPDIVNLKFEKDTELQNYQEFNEVRGHWYRENGFSSDFPAATGIGTRGRVVRLEIIAGETGEDIILLSLHNPDQRNAHQYSYNKLVGSNKESTPLFERGKIIFAGNRGYIWVSGTAAIKGEDSIAGSVIEQTDITCENIDRLIDFDNLVNSGLESRGYDIEPVYIRAYVKYGTDGPLVKEFLASKYPGALVHVLEADVCREELLVEVEAEFTISQFSNP